MRTSSALETGFFGKASDKQNVFVILKRKYLVLILEENYTFVGNISCVYMVFVLIPDLLIIMIINGLEHKV